MIWNVHIDTYAYDEATIILLDFEICIRLMCGKGIYRESEIRKPAIDQLFCMRFWLAGSCDIVYCAT